MGCHHCIINHPDPLPHLTCTTMCEIVLFTVDWIVFVLEVFITTKAFEGGFL